MSLIARLLAILSLLALGPSTAWAGRIFLFAAGADMTTVGSNSCVRVLSQGTTYAYTTVNCTDLAGGRFEIPAAFPSDAGNSWTFRVHYETPDTTANKVCSYNISPIALPSGADSQGLGLVTAVTVSGASTTHVAGRQYITPQSAAFTTWNGLTNDVCTGTACQNTRLKVIIEPNIVAGTASSCNFSMLEIIY